MKFLEFFNPLDIDHLRAYQHLQKKGTWPANFIPVDIEFDQFWQVMIQAKMSDLWVGTNIFMHDMRPDKNQVDLVLNMDRLFDIAKDFEKKRKKDG